MVKFTILSREKVTFFIYRFIVVLINKEHIADSSLCTQVHGRCVGGVSIDKRVICRVLLLCGTEFRIEMLCWPLNCQIKYVKRRQQQHVGTSAPTFFFNFSNPAAGQLEPQDIWSTMEVMLALSSQLRHVQPIHSQCSWVE